MDNFFTSESVSEGHPDKVSDQISDAILDACIKKNKYARVACEVLIKTGLILIAGEISESLNFDQIARDVVNNIGYNNANVGFNANICSVMTVISNQSKDIAIGINKKNMGAGDQGFMFGYATDETDVFMPAPIMYAHLLMKRQAYVRKTGILPWLRPDAKSQVTFCYHNNMPTYISCIVFSTQHDEDIKISMLKNAIIEEIIKPVIPKKFLNKNTKFFINPTGRFVIGGPTGDCGLTGRKIIVDTYGGFARHGGGAFSGKDPSKVDRSGAYIARYIAKNIVASGLARRCEIQISYSIGVSKPVSIFINTFGTGKVSDSELSIKINDLFNLSPLNIIKSLELLRPIYQKTAVYGHFGRKDVLFSWEKTDKIEDIKRLFKI